MGSGRRCATGVGLFVALTLLAAVGCTHQEALPPKPQATPYQGPLRVEQTRPPTGPDQGGAAGLAVRCRTEPTGYNRFTDKHEGGVFTTPRAALDDGLGNSLIIGPPEDFQKVAETRERVMYTYQPEGVTVVALVAYLGVSIDGTSGWYAESLAWCDPAEFPDSVTRASGLGIWTDSSGRRVLTTEIVSNVGPRHCGWEQLTFLHLGGDGPSDLAYVAGVRPGLDEYFDEPYRQNLPLPPDAVETGYSLGDDQLWLSSDRRRAYVGSPSQVDLWPRTNKLLGCV